jgi:hypothetical protein
MPKQSIIFVVDDEKDADLLAWLEDKRNRSATIRNAIRVVMEAEAGNGQTTAITEAVSEALAGEMACLPDLVARTVKDALASYRLAPAQQETLEGEEPAAAAANLDGLLDRLANGALD